MTNYSGRCHCGAIQFRFKSPKIEKGLRCNCSICRRRGAIMTPFMLAPGELEIDCEEAELATYQFSTQIAQHHFCPRCGIYPFHQTMRKPGHYRVNLGCVDGIESLSLPFDVFDGHAI